jgi:hypothetical protein
MAVQTVHLSKQKLVFISTEVPDECVRRAQVVIVSEAGWHLIGPAPFRAHGLGNAMPLPQVRCPVVDVSAVTDDVGMKRVLDGCVTLQAGVINLAGLLTGLEALGGVVLKDPTPSPSPRLRRGEGSRKQKKARVQ